MHTVDTKFVLQKTQSIGLLEYVCQALELSETQFTVATERYEAVGKWLSAVENSVLRSTNIYPQGSIALGTTVRPLGRQEYDIDLVCFVALGGRLRPGDLKRIVGDRLRLNGRYRDILEEKPRCWRLNYANEFHLDITPSVPNPACLRGGELVPNRRLYEWKPTNPKGYRHWFDDYASLQPRIQIDKMELAGVRAQIEVLPAPTRLRGLLRRCVQLCKRNRDVFFDRLESGMAPISIIITTLAAKSYGYCVARGEYETEFDLLVEVMRHMPSFIATVGRSGERGWFVWNETTEGENFAEKWNQQPNLAAAFYEWHAQALRAFEELPTSTGLDQVATQLSSAFGDVGTRAVRKFTEVVSVARSEKRLSVLAGGGLTTISPGAIKIPSNTFYGAVERK